MFASAPAAMPHAKAGRLKALAVTSLQPSALAPGLPPVAATVPGFEWVPVTGVFVPAKTPKVAIDKLNQEMSRYLKTPEAKQKFLSFGSDAVGSSPEELAARVRADINEQGKLIKDLGLREN
jgi:tripartite-type tricarboxylate transporter receptor subunit TctC